VVNGGKSFGSRRHWQPVRAIYKIVDNSGQVGFPRTAQMLNRRHIGFDQPLLRIGRVACIASPSALILRTSDFGPHVVLHELFDPIMLAQANV